MKTDLRDRRIEAIRLVRERCDALGIKRGRKKGSICAKKLDGRESEIIEMLLDNRSIEFIATKLNVSSKTLSDHLSRMGLEEFRQKGKKEKSFALMDEHVEFIKANINKVGSYSMAWQLGVSKYYYEQYCKERNIG